MYAVIKAGGKQHKVKSGDVLEIELTHDAQGDEITFTPILVVDDEGTTHFGKELGRAVVRAKVRGEQKGDKIKIFKYRPKTGYSRRQGHRQMHTLVEITDVSMGRRPAKKETAEPAEPPVEGTEPAASSATGAPEGPDLMAQAVSEEASAPAATERMEEEVEGATQTESDGGKEGSAEG
jgi:large subunit ribosomal protein L21